MTTLEGAKASMRIRFPGDLIALSARLSKGLEIHDFRIGHREDPPYDVVGSCEALGFEMWLEERSESEDPFRFLFTLSSQESSSSKLLGKMHDLSPWFAQFTSLVCRIDCLVTGTDILFSNGKESPLS